MNAPRTPETADPDRCPLCGGPNNCAMQAQRRTGEPQPPCWCVTVNFSEDLLARVPVRAQRKACICADCAQRDAPLRRTP
jgi:Cysteine-rich CWC